MNSIFSLINNTLFLFSLLTHIVPDFLLPTTTRRLIFDLASPIFPLQTRTSALAPSSLTSTTTRFDNEDESFSFNKNEGNWRNWRNWGKFGKLEPLKSKKGENKTKKKKEVLERKNCQCRKVDNLA